MSLPECEWNVAGRAEPRPAWCRACSEPSIIVHATRAGQASQPVAASIPARRTIRLSTTPSSSRSFATVAFSAASSACRCATFDFSTAMSEALTGSRSGFVRARRREDLRRRRTGQQVRPARFARAGLARQLDHERAGRPRRELVQESLDRGDVGEAMQAIAVDPQLAHGLRPAQHQGGDQRHRLRGHRQHPLGVVRVAHDAAAARFDDERQCLQLIERRLHLGFARIEDGIAARLLVAARGEREQRERVGVGHRVLLLDQDAQDAGLEQRKDGWIHGGGGLAEPAQCSA